MVSVIQGPRGVTFKVRGYFIKFIYEIFYKIGLEVKKNVNYSVLEEWDKVPSNIGFSQK